MLELLLSSEALLVFVVVEEEHLGHLMAEPMFLQHDVDSSLDLLVTDPVPLQPGLFRQVVLRLADCNCEAHLLLIMSLHKAESRHTHIYYQMIGLQLITYLFGGNVP